MNKFFKALTIGVFFLLTVVAIQAKTINVVDYGAVPDDGEDDSNNINFAIGDLIQSGGGTIIFPSGVFDVKGEMNFAPDVMMSLKLVGDKGSVINLSGAENVNYFVITRAIQFEIENLNFIADNNVPLNAERVIWVKEAVHSRIKGSSFFGIGAKSAVVQFDNTNASVEESVFCGSGSQGSIVRANNSKGLRVSKTEFRANGSFLGADYTKGETINPESWLSILNPVTGDGAMGQGSVSVKDSYFGDGARFGVKVTNQKNVEVFGSTFVVSDMKNSAGIFLANVPYADVDAVSFTGVASQRNAILLSDGCFVDVNALILSEINLVSKDPESTINVRYCPGCGTPSSAQKVQ